MPRASARSDNGHIPCSSSACAFFSPMMSVPTSRSTSAALLVLHEDDILHSGDLPLHDASSAITSYFPFRLVPPRQSVASHPVAFLIGLSIVISLSWRLMDTRSCFTSGGGHCGLRMPFFGCSRRPSLLAVVVVLRE